MAKIRKSCQREALLAELRSRKDHPSAEMLYDALKKEYPHMSLGTVYRNLALLTGLGEIKKIPCAGDSERYDGFTGPHDHFVCRVCGRVVDVMPAGAAGNADEEKTAAVHGTAVPSEIGDVESHSLTFYGICRECKNKAAKQ